MRQRMWCNHLDARDDFQPRCRGGQKKGRKPPGTGGFTGARQNHIEIGNTAIGDIGLLSIQDISALPARGGGRHGGDIGTRQWLGQCKGGNGRSASCFPQPGSLGGGSKQRNSTHAKPLHGEGEIGEAIMAG